VAKALFSLSGVPPLLGWVLKFVLIIALMRLFSGALFDFYKTSWVPVDLIVSFFQRYDAYSYTTGQYDLQMTFYKHARALLALQEARTGLRALSDWFPYQDIRQFAVWGPKLFWKAKTSGLVSPAFFCFMTDNWDSSGDALTPLWRRYLFLLSEYFYLKPTIIIPLVNQNFDAALRFFLLNDLSHVFLFKCCTSGVLVTLLFCLVFSLFVIMSISSFYYFRLIKTVYLAPKHSFLYYNQNSGNINVSLSLSLLAVFFCLINLFGTFFFQAFNNWVFLVFCLNSIGF